MSDAPQLWMRVGGNGAGKSTVDRLALEPRGLPFVNADRLARIAFPEDPLANSYAAALLAKKFALPTAAGRTQFLLRDRLFPSLQDRFRRPCQGARSQIIMVWIHLESPELNQARVASRVSEGGHPVPADKVISRIPRLLRHVRASIPLVDVLRIYDNSCLDDPFRPVLSITQGVLERHQNPLPLWASDWLAEMDAPS